MFSHRKFLILANKKIIVVIFLLHLLRKSISVITSISSCKYLNAQEYEKSNVPEITDLLRYWLMLEILAGKH